MRAVRRWQEAAGITEGALFRRIWSPPSAGTKPLPAPAVGIAAIDPGTVARTTKKRGAMMTGMEGGIQPTRLNLLGRHKTNAALDEYRQFGDPFEGHPPADVL